MRTAGESASIAPLSQWVRIDDVIAVSGQVGFRPGTTEVVGDGIEEQTRQTLENVLRVLSEGGASEEDILKVGVYLADPGDFAAMNRVYEQFFTSPRPARTTVAVGLQPGIKIEIDALAVLT